MKIFINTKCRSNHPKIPYVGLVIAKSAQMAAAILYQKNLAYGIYAMPKGEDMEEVPLAKHAMVLSGSEDYGYNTDRKYVPNYSMDELLEKVEYWVEANHAEQSFIWDRFSPRSQSIGLFTKVDYNEANYGIGFVTKPIPNTDRTTTVMVSPFLLNGVLCAFYNPTSVTVAWDMVEDFLKENAKNFKNRHCDANNFHNCIHATEEIAKQ